MRALGAQNREKHYAFHNIMRPWGANKFDKKTQKRCSFANALGTWAHVPPMSCGGVKQFR